MGFDIEERMRALRGEESAESAALNSMKEEAEAADLYLKRAKEVPDPQARKIYKDIAGEEMQHLGEAAQLLDNASPEMAEKVPEGMDEVKRKLDLIRTPPGWHPDIDGTMDEMMTRRR